MPGGLLHGDTDSMQQGANAGNTAVEHISGIQRSLQSSVDMMPAAWSGTAPPAFYSAFADWTAGVNRLNAALSHMSHATVYSVGAYGQADHDGAHAVNAAVGLSPFGGSLGGSATSA